MVSPKLCLYYVALCNHSNYTTISSLIMCTLKINWVYFKWNSNAKKTKKKKIKTQFLKLSKNIIGISLFPLYYFYSIIVFGFWLKPDFILICISFVV